MSGINLFAGANTAQGFYSFFNYLARDDLQRVFILKGGPGTGKSTFMHKVIEELANKRIDKYFCSADPNSLDGIYIRDYDATIVDGTAPHTIDPHLPGAVQEIIDLGRCFGKELIRSRQEILQLSIAKASQFNLAYRWLDLAARQEDIIQSTRKAVSPEQIRTDVQCIAQLLPEKACGHNTQAFATAITGSGYTSFLHELERHAPVRIFLVGGNREYNNRVLQGVKTILLQRQIPAVFLHCSLQPQYLEHIYVADVIAIFSKQRPHHQFTTGKEFGPQEPVFSDLEKEQAISIQRGREALYRAQQLHAEIEKIYIPQMDFACVDEQRASVMAKIAQLKSRT